MVIVFKWLFVLLITLAPCGLAFPCSAINSQWCGIMAMAFFCCKPVMPFYVGKVMRLLIMKAINKLSVLPILGCSL